MSRTNNLSPPLLLIATALGVSVLMVLWPTLPTQAQSENADNDNVDPQRTNEHLVTFSDEGPSEDHAKQITDLGGTVVTSYDQIGVAVVSGLTDASAEDLNSSEGVQSVDRDMKRKWLDPREKDTAEEAFAEEGTAAEVEQESPNKDPQTADRYPRQWHLRAIKADQAWAAGKLGSSNVRVAILDTGIDYTHPDLADRVDLGLSKSFVPAENAVVQTNFPGAHEIADLQYHGTHVAATVSSNAHAAAGVTSKVKLMGVKVLDRNGDGTDSGVLAGILHAADNGADVINMSLGSNFSKSEAGKRGVVATYNRALSYAYKKGTTIVVSAGNSGDKLNDGSNLYKAFCESPHVVCVSATGPTNNSLVEPWTNIDALASYSNYGSPITVAAPGGNASRVWAACSRFSLAQPVCQTGTFVLGMNGTSMAAPHASGLAALLVEQDQISKGHPSEVASKLRNSADDLGASGKDEIYGHGRINVAKALGLKGANTKPSGK